MQLCLWAVLALIPVSPRGRQNQSWKGGRGDALIFRMCLSKVSWSLESHSGLTGALGSSQRFTGAKNKTICCLELCSLRNVQLDFLYTLHRNFVACWPFHWVFSRYWSMPAAVHSTVWRSVHWGWIIQLQNNPLNLSLFKQSGGGGSGEGGCWVLKSEPEHLVANFSGHGFFALLLWISQLWGQMFSP